MGGVSRSPQTFRFFVGGGRSSKTTYGFVGVSSNLYIGRISNIVVLGLLDFLSNNVIILRTFVNTKTIMNMLHLSVIMIRFGGL